MRISYSKSSMIAIIKLTESDTSGKALSALRLIRDNVGFEVTGSKVIESTSDMIKISCADCSYEDVKIFYDLCKKISFCSNSKRVIEYSVVEYRIYDNEFTYHIENYLLFNRNTSRMAYRLVRETKKPVSYSSNSGITGRILEKDLFRILGTEPEKPEILSEPDTVPEITAEPTPERDPEELSYINPDYASQECELCSECIHYSECKEEGTVVMQHDCLCMYSVCSSSECCPYFLTSEQIAEEEAGLYDWANSLTQSQIDYLCNGGWYNGTIKGYLISAAQEVGFTNEQISELLNGLRFAFSLKDKADADRIYHDFLVSNDILPF